MKLGVRLEDFFFAKLEKGQGKRSRTLSDRDRHPVLDACRTGRQHVFRVGLHTRVPSRFFSYLHRTAIALEDLPSELPLANASNTAFIYRQYVAKPSLRKHIGA
jgi:hypothetical protein